MTGPQYVCQLYLTSDTDEQKFYYSFNKHLSYTKEIHEEMRAWVKLNIVRWKEERPKWFVIEMIPDDFLPQEVFEEEGEAKRRRSAGASVREMIGLEKIESGRVYPAP